MLRLIILTTLAGGCSAGPTLETKNDPGPAQPVPAADPRRKMTRSECAAEGGVVVGDMGNGAVFKSDYRCPTGNTPPIGNIFPEAGEPIAMEGEVCCPRGAVNPRP